MTDRIPTKVLANGAIRYGVYDDSGALLRYEYIKPEDEPTVEGTPLNVAALYSDAVAKIHGLTSAAVPSDGFTAAARLTGWQKLAGYTTAGTYTWTAPDMYGDGRSYDIGILVIGAGGSGAAFSGIGTNSTFNATRVFCGGASGRSVSYVLTVTPGNTYSAVVGAGGTAVLAANTGSLSAWITPLAGNDGGSSAFNGKTALGGCGGGCGSLSSGDYTRGANGGQGSAANGGGSASASHINYYGGYIGQYNGVTADGVTYPAECYNPFEARLILGAGGGAYGNLYPSTGIPTATASAGGKSPVTGLGGGNAVASTVSGAGVTGATGGEPGCGGGAAVQTNGGTAKSGAGAAGAVYIYAKGVAV